METSDVKKATQQAVDELKRIRDEVRLELHLASMDAKDAWAKLEPRVAEAERMAHDASEVSKKAVDELVGRFREFRARLGKQ